MPTQSAAPLGQTPTFGGTLLLAADATPAARAAVAVASAVAFHQLMPVAAVTVLTTTSESDSELLVRQQMQHVQTRSLAWQHDVIAGNPAQEILRRAMLLRAQLIVMGLRPHAVVDRLFRDETALAVMQQATVPTLAIIASMRTLPTTVVVGMDFSRSSIAAMHAAASLLAPGGRLFLVYVAPDAEMWARTATRLSSLYETQLAETFARLVTDVKSRWGVVAESYVVHGPVVPELREFTREHSGDLIAIGKCSDSHAQCVLGSVATALTRTAECSLLVAPA